MTYTSCGNKILMKIIRHHTYIVISILGSLRANNKLIYIRNNYD